MDFSSVFEYKSVFINGLYITLFASFITVCLGSILGMFICLLTTSRHIILRFIGNVYVEVFRGTPILLQLFIIWFGLKELGVVFLSIPALNLPQELFAGIFCLTLNSAAYIAEIYRGGIQSIDKGQSEAALSLGFSKAQTFKLVVFPQALKNVLPSLGNEFITLIKESSLLSVLGVKELMYAYKATSGATYVIMEPLIVVGVCYFIITFTLSKLVKNLEWRLSKNA